MPIRFVFDEKKAAQAAAVLIRCQREEVIGYYDLAKLLYLAERESLRRTGEALTGDRLSAMRQGPILSNAYDCMKPKNAGAGYWGSHLVTGLNEDESPRTVRVLRDPGVDELCPLEIRLLRELAARYDGPRGSAQLRKDAHLLPEFTQYDPSPADTSVTIPVEALIEAVGRSADLDAIADNARSQAAFARM